MAVRLKADGTGKCAIYTGTDDLPFTSPLSYVSRLRFHSDLTYPRFVSTYTGSISLSAIGANTTHQQTHVLTAHGLGGTPFVEGYATVGGVRIPLTGTVPIIVGSSTDTQAASGFCRWLHLGANGTNIIVQEFTNTSSTATNYPGVTFGATSVSITALITDYLV